MFVDKKEGRLTPFMLKYTCIFLLILFSSLSVSGEEPFSPEKVHVVASLYEPFVMLKNGRITGFDMDLLDVIFRVRGIEYEVTLTSFQEMLHRVEEGSADIGAGCIYVNSERRELFSFSRHYLRGGLVTVMKPGSTCTSIERAENCRVGVKNRATGEALAMTYLSKGNVLSVRTYDDTIESFNGLVRGEVDLVLNDFYNSIFLIQRYFPGEIGIAESWFGPGLLDSRDIAFPVNRQKRYLKRMIDEELENLEGSFVFKSIYSKWFSVGYPVRIHDYIWIVVTIIISIGLLIVALVVMRNRKFRIRTLFESEKYFRELVEKLTIGLFILKDGKIKVINEEGKKLIGYSRPEGNEYGFFDDYFNLYRMISPGGAEGSDAELNSFSEMMNFCHNRPENPWGCLGKWLRRDGTVLGTRFRLRQVEWMGHEAVELAVQDMTSIWEMQEEKDRLTTQLIHSQKLEGIGLLAGGIAHEFNNILTIVLGYAGMIIRKSSEEKTVKSAKVISEAGERAASLTSKLLTFARKSPYLKELVSMHSSITDTMDLLKRTFDPNIRIESHLKAGRDIIKGDKHQIQQVLMNISINARDAMPDGGILSISTDNVEVIDHRRESYEEINPGVFIRVVITDTGCGLSPEYLNQIFEPFFTTKPAGKGTGLGLSMVYGAVRQHGGFIETTSRIGEGTSFYIYFPLAEPGTAEEGKKDEAATTGQGKILVIDDDLHVLNYLSSFLEESGFTVKAFQDSGKGLDFILKEGGDIDTVVLDLIMPGIDGRHLLESIRELRPGLPVIIVTGFASEETLNRLRELGVTAILPKPVDTGELLTLLSGSTRTRQ